MISKNIKKYYEKYITDEKELEQDLKIRLKEISKPCWELKMCPYGYLVEEFPLPGITKSKAKEHIEYLKECIKHNKMGPNFDIKMSDFSKAYFIKEIEDFNENDYDDGPFKIEEEMSCKEFGHLCPVYFVSEPFTETEKVRKRSRSISRETALRVARRDNYNCQICGKHLQDAEIEYDHIIPYSRGGHSEESNIRITCRECNRKKSNKISELVG